MSESFLQIKEIINILAHLNVLIGLAGLTGGIFVLDVSKKYNQFCGTSCVFNFSYYLQLSLAGFSFLIYGIGKLAYQKQKNYLVSFHHIMIFIGFAASCAFLFLQFSSLGDIKMLKSDASCQTEDLLIDYKSVYDNAKNLLCNKENDCACNAMKPNFSKTEISGFYINKENGAHSAQECPEFENKLSIGNFQSNYEQKSDYLEDIIDVLQLIETNFNCGGFCSESSYYIFKDINDGRPDYQDCKIQFIDFLEKNATVLVIQTFLFCAFYFTHSILSAILIRKRDTLFGYFPENFIPTKNNQQSTNSKQQINHKASIQQNTNTLINQQLKLNPCPNPSSHKVSLIINPKSNEDSCQITIKQQQK